jgi:hypothetical protein
MILKFHFSLSHSPDDDLNDSHIMPDLNSGLAAFNCLRQKLNLRLQTKKTAKTKTFASTQNKVNWNSRDSFGVFGSLFNLFFKNIPSNLIFLATNIFF